MRSRKLLTLEAWNILQKAPGLTLRKEIRKAKKLCSFSSFSSGMLILRHFSFFLISIWISPSRVMINWEHYLLTTSPKCRWLTLSCFMRATSRIWDTYDPHFLHFSHVSFNWECDHLFWCNREAPSKSKISIERHQVWLNGRNLCISLLDIVTARLKLSQTLHIMVLCLEKINSSFIDKNESLGSAYHIQRGQEKARLLCTSLLHYLSACQYGSTYTHQVNDDLSAFVLFSQVVLAAFPLFILGLLRSKIGTLSLYFIPKVINRVTEMIDLVPTHSSMIQITIRRWEIFLTERGENLSPISGWKYLAISSLEFWSKMRAFVGPSVWWIFLRFLLLPRSIQRISSIDVFSPILSNVFGTSLDSKTIKTSKDSRFPLLLAFLSWWLTCKLYEKLRTAANERSIPELRRVFIDAEKYLFWTLSLLWLLLIVFSFQICLSGGRIGIERIRCEERRIEKVSPQWFFPRTRPYAPISCLHSWHCSFPGNAPYSLIVPYQKFLDNKMPLDHCGRRPPRNHDPFPNQQVFIESVKQEVTVFHSQANPKQVPDFAVFFSFSHYDSSLSSEQMEGSILFLLRQEMIWERTRERWILYTSISESIFSDHKGNLLNTFLASDPESSQRHLNMRFNLSIFLLFLFPACNYFQDLHGHTTRWGLWHHRMASRCHALSKRVDAVVRFSVEWVV